MKRLVTISGKTYKAIFPYKFIAGIMLLLYNNKNRENLDLC